jgi:hypothetical protein
MGLGFGDPEHRCSFPCVPVPGRPCRA